MDLLSRFSPITAVQTETVFLFKKPVLRSVVPSGHEYRSADFGISRFTPQA